MANQSSNYLISCIDFVENYSLMEQNEIQTQHWHNFQITILVHLTWRINLNFRVGNDGKTRVITEYHFYISYDRTHESICSTLFQMTLELAPSTKYRTPLLNT
jgi:hypothetical protein